MLEQKPFLQKIKFLKDQVPNSKIFPFNIPFLKHFDTLKFHKNVTFLVGENGIGKSTLIESIAEGLGLSSEGGTKNFNLKTHQNTSDSLHPYFNFSMSYLKPKDYYFLRAESFYNVASYMDEVNYLKSYGGKSLHQQSHGESFLAVLKNKLKGEGLYILDEPESALSPQGQLNAIAIIDKLVKSDSQFIIATHSPILLAYPNAKIIQIDENGLTQLQLEDTDHYRLYSAFFKNPKGLIGRIIENRD